VTRSTLLGLASILVVGTAVAQAAVGQLTCTSSASTITANLSYYDFGFANTLNIGSSSSGAGAGKVTFSPLEVHTSLINFLPFFKAVTTGATFSSCTLATKTGGNSIDYTFRLVAVSSVDAIARSPRAPNNQPAAYLDVKMAFGAVEVTTSGGDDDGGNEGGWNQVTNTPE